MAKIQNAITARRRLSLGLAAAVAVVALLTLVPFPYETIVGYNLAFTDLAPNLQFDSNAYLASLTEWGYGNVSVNWNQSGDHLTCRITGLPSEQAAENAAAAFKALTGVNAVPGIEPVKKTVSGSLCAQAYQKFFSVEVSTEGKTQEEIIAEI